MNKRGFTLVELLAVIVVLAIIILLAMPRVIGIMENAKVNSFAAEASEITKVARTAYNNKLLQEGTTDSTLCFTVDELIKGGLIDKEKGDVRGAVVIDLPTGSNADSSTMKIYSFLSKKNYYVKNDGGSKTGDISGSDVKVLKNNSSVFNSCSSICTATAHAASVMCGSTDITTMPSSGVSAYTVTFDADGGVINGQTFINLKGESKYTSGHVVNATWGTDHLIFDRTNQTIVTFGVYNPTTILAAADFSIDSYSETVNQVVFSNVQNGGFQLGVLNNEHASKPQYLYAALVIGGSTRVLYSKAIAQLNQRYKVIMSYDGVYYKFFVNGELAQKINTTAEITQPAEGVPVVLGANPNANTLITGAVDSYQFSGKLYNAYMSTDPRYTKSVIKNGTYGTLPVPSKPFHTFTGWYDANNNLVTSSTVYTASSNTELTAKYTYNG